MAENIFDALMPCLIERLGRIYNRDDEYQQDINREMEIFNHLAESLTGEQKKQLEEYQTATCATAGVCEILAYKQGMRDLATIMFFTK